MHSFFLSPCGLFCHAFLFSIATWLILPCISFFYLHPYLVCLLPDSLDSNLLPMLSLKPLCYRYFQWSNRKLNHDFFCTNYGFFQLWFAHCELLYFSCMPGNWNKCTQKYSQMQSQALENVNGKKKLSRSVSGPWLCWLHHLIKHITLRIFLVAFFVAKWQEELAFHLSPHFIAYLLTDMSSDFSCGSLCHAFLSSISGDIFDPLFS